VRWTANTEACPDEEVDITAAEFTPKWGSEILADGIELFLLRLPID
jgi:hypothetical protein